MLPPLKCLFLSTLFYTKIPLRTIFTPLGRRTSFYNLSIIDKNNNMKFMYLYAVSAACLSAAPEKRGK